MLILNKKVSEEIIKKIIIDIKKKKELAAVEDEFVKDLLIQYLSQKSKLIDFLIEHELKTLPRSSKYKQLIKDIRATLRKVYGVFQKQIKEREEYLKEKEYVSILKSHLSTKERLPIYKELYEKLWEIIGKPKSIIDLAAGMNPFSFEFMNLDKVKYFASELSKEDVKFIQKYFDSEKRISGKTRVINLLKIKKNPQLLKKLPNSDVCFLFKVLDSIELTRKEKIGEIIIENVPVRWVIVSFPTRTISQKKMEKGLRRWKIENMCKRLDFEFKRLNLLGEVFYIIKK